MHNGPPPRTAVSPSPCSRARQYIVLPVTSAGRGPGDSRPDLVCPPMQLHAACLHSLRSPSALLSPPPSPSQHAMSPFPKQQPSQRCAHSASRPARSLPHLDRLESYAACLASPTTSPRMTRSISSDSVLAIACVSQLSDLTARAFSGHFPRASGAVWRGARGGLPEPLLRVPRPPRRGHRGVQQVWRIARQLRIFLLFWCFRPVWLEVKEVWELSTQPRPI
eukprot:366226-Chlamydomonas_euryale.AAC.21